METNASVDPLISDKRTMPVIGDLTVAVKNPAILNIDPFGEGWIAEIVPDDISELNGLMNSSDYKSFIA